MSGEDIEQPPRFDPRPADVELLPQDEFDHRDPRGSLLLSFYTPVPVPYVRSLRIELEDQSTGIRINCRVTDLIALEAGQTYVVELVPYAYGRFWTDSTWVTLALRSRHIEGHDWTQDINRIILYPSIKEEGPYVLWNNAYVMISRPYSAASEPAGGETGDEDDLDLEFACTDNAPSFEKYLTDLAER